MIALRPHQVEINLVSPLKEGREGGISAADIQAPQIALLMHLPAQYKVV